MEAKQLFSVKKPISLPQKAMVKKRLWEQKRHLAHCPAISSPLPVMAVEASGCFLNHQGRMVYGKKCTMSRVSWLLFENTIHLLSTLQRPTVVFLPGDWIAQL